MSDSRTQPTLHELSTTFTLENRFKRDFETISQIGTGGFSKVYKARNLLDDNTYAVKKIVVNMAKKSVHKIKNNIETVLKEIRCLAKIKNDYFVRYNHAWIEVELKENAKVVKSPKEALENSIDYEEDYSHSLDKENSFVLSYIENDKTLNNNFNDLPEEKCNCVTKCNCEIVHFDNYLHNIQNYVEMVNEYNDEGSTYENLRNKKKTSRKNKNILNLNNNNNNNDNLINFPTIKNKNNPNTKKTSQNKKDSEDMIKINQDSYKIKDIQKLKIYIQMELCKETLADVLSRRQNLLISPTTGNNKPLHLPQYNPNNEEMLFYLQTFLHLSKAVQFLHEKEKIIHRDLKPNNIFFTDSGNVQIGDFGLATELFNKKYKKFSIETCDTLLSRKNSKDSDYSSTSFSSNKEYNEVSISNISYHTKNIGTLIYASPEQLNNNFYDEKSDIYSLGLILFEMVYPLKTGMEKHGLFKELKENGKLPENFCNKFPTLAALILEMTSKNAMKRPTSREIIIKIKEEIKKINKKFTTDVGKLKTYETMVKIENESMPEHERMKTYFLKIMNEDKSPKLLIYAKRDSSKALFVYDLKECEITFIKEKDCVEIDNPIMNKIIVTGKDLDGFIEKLHTLLL